MKIKLQLEKVNKMDSKQRITYTKNCLEILNYKCITSDDKDFIIYEGNYNNLPEMIDANFNDGFLNNWNWIMEVKSKICQSNRVDEFNTQYDSVAQGFHCSITPVHNDSFKSIYTNVYFTEKDAVLQAINQFLIWWSANKT